ncbi:hypothetical protein TPELB_23590 [Terrisporobacter petrolearius]|uniref:Phage portal protein, HK97 family n=1 Tax=Terrisporobacter petrolearius TaxID=1460447 RepID=A0ABZ3FFQ9_9FIRM
MLFRNIVSSVNDNTSPWYEDWYYMFKNTPTSSGECVTPQHAFNNIGVVYQCIVIRANSLAKLPLQLYKQSLKGKQRDKNHNLWYLIEKRPNKWQTPSQFKSYIEVSRCLYGNAYIRMVYDMRGNIIALEPLDSSKTYIQKINGNYYFVSSTDEGKVLILSEDEVIHIPYVSLDGKIGKAPIEVARENAGNLQSITKFEGGFYKNGAMNTGVIESPGQLSPEAKEKIKAEWVRLYGGASNAGSVAVLDAGFGYKQLNLPMKDIEFIASRKMNKAEIATIFDVPLYMLNELDNAKFNNVEQQNLRYLNDVLQATITAIEEEFNYKAFTLAESKEYYVKFNLNSMLRADSKTRSEYYKEMIGTGIMTINNVCDLEDLNNIGEMGDKHFMSLNYTTLDTIEQHSRLKGGDNNEE